MDQDSITALIKRAEICRDSGHTAEARELYNRVLALRPNEEFSTLGLGVCARREGDHLTALEFHRRAHEHHPHSYWPHVEAAEDYFSLGRWAEAEAEWHAVLALKPDEINALRGMVRLARMHNDEAAALLALTSIPDQTEEIVLERAQLLSALERRDEALSLLHSGAEQFPQNPEFLIEIATLERQAGNLPGTQAALEAAIPRDPRNPKALLKLSDLARQTHNHALALHYLTQAKRGCAKDIWVDLCLAQTLFELGRYTECDAALTEAQTAYDGHFLVAQIRGELLAKRGLLDEAQAVLAEAMHARPDNESLALLAAELAHRAGQAARAAQLAAAIAPVRDPGHKTRWLLLQAAIAEDSWRREDAAALYRRLEDWQRDSRPALEGQIRLALLSGDLELSNEKLLKFARLEMPDRHARGLSANLSQSFWGQYHEEHAFEPEAMERIRELTREPAALRLAPLMELAQRLPDWTPASCAVLLAFREGGLLDRVDAEPAAQPGIPQRILQYWHAETPPPDIAALMETWPAAHPGWEYRRFTDASARAWLQSHAPEALRAYLNTQSFAQKSDVLRLALLLHEGGWYADADDRCLAPLTTLGTNGAALATYQEEFATLGNNLIGAQPEHRAIELALAGAITALMRSDRDIIWLSTGPGLLTRSFISALLEQGGRRPEFLRSTALLTKPALRRSVAPHCHARYKFTGEHWSDTQFIEAVPVASKPEPAA